LPIKCEFKPNGVIITHKGSISGNEFFQANHDIYSHQYHDELQFQLIDLTDVDEVNVTAEDVAELAEMDRKVTKAKKRFACVIAPTDYLFAMSRAWNMQSESDYFENNVVHNMDDAIAWFKSKGIKINFQVAK